MGERRAVQNPLLRYSEEIGWEYVKPTDATHFRQGESGNYFKGLLENAIVNLNPGIITPDRLAGIWRRLNLLSPNVEGNRQALSWLRGEQSVFVADENRERNLTLVDFANPLNNVFQVTDEWTYKGLTFNNRADVVFLINGIPVAIAETKSASKPEGLEEGVDQIRRYHRETPEMFTATQVFEVTQMLDFFYGASWSTARKNVFRWKVDEPSSYEKMVKAFFDPATFLKLLKDYIVFIEGNDGLVKVILRQHQVRAVDKVVTRAHDATRNRGLIWHTQGSGKTYTMITAAAKVLREGTGDKPTVLMVIDRNELETQLTKNVESYGIHAYEVARSKRELRRILSSDYRGLVISMIHKFDDIPPDLNTRANIVVLVDEAHRTTGGDLGNYLMAALPNATYIGFTGTPIDNIERGKGTFKVFGYQDETGYLDKYSIRESVDDGTTKPLNYSLAPSELRLERETLDKQFLELADAQGVTDIEELNAILDKAVALKEVLKAPDRMALVSKLVADHFRANVEPMGFKAFLVAVDREACALYKKDLDKILPPEMTEVVYSSAHNDKPLLREFALTPEKEKQIRSDFTKKNKQPKILIVTEKLLTGYDSPILYCMYLDKPMRDHVLLQAIARVNRPYEDDEGLVKQYGLIVDFVGIFEKLEKALAFDSDIVASVIQNIDILKELFARLIDQQAPQYLKLTERQDDKGKEAAIEHFRNPDTRNQFYTFFRQVQTLYDILSPAPHLRPYVDRMKSLAELYGLIRNAYRAHLYVDREFTRKTQSLVRDNVATYYMRLPDEEYELNVETLKKIRESGASSTTKILNLRKLLVTIKEKLGASQPALVPIVERVEALVERYVERQEETEDTLAKVFGGAQAIVDAPEESKRLGVDMNTYAVYIMAKQFVPELTVEQAVSLNSVFAKYPDYRWNGRQEQQLRAELYKLVLPITGASKMVEVVSAIMELRRQ